MAVGFSFFTGTANAAPIQDTFNIRILQPGNTEEKPSYFEEAEGVVPDETNAGPEVAPVFVFIRDTVNFLSAIVGSFALLVFVIGGIYLLISEGQEDRIQKGKQAMIFSMIGLAIALFAYAITTIVQSLLF